MKRVLPLLIALILITSVLVTAAGRSTGFNEEKPQVVKIQQAEEKVDRAQDRSVQDKIIEQRKQRRKETISQRAKEVIRKSQESCEKFGVRRDRIKCRLKQEVTDYAYEKEFALAPEACRKIQGDERKASCVALYKRSTTCYDKEGTEKDKCFRRAIGHTRKTMKGADREVKKEYLILLLYDLQQRVEWSYDQGKVDDDITAVIVDLIVQIKQKVLDQAPRREVKALLTQLRSLMKSARPGQGAAA